MRHTWKIFIQSILTPWQGVNMSVVRPVLWTNYEIWKPHPYLDEHIYTIHWLLLKGSDLHGAWCWIAAKYYQQRCTIIKSVWKIHLETNHIFWLLRINVYCTVNEDRFILYEPVVCTCEKCVITITCLFENRLSWCPYQSESINKLQVYILVQWPPHTSMKEHGSSWKNSAVWAPWSGATVGHWRATATCLGTQQSALFQPSLLDEGPFHRPHGLIFGRISPGSNKMDV